MRTQEMWTLGQGILTRTLPRMVSRANRSILAALSLSPIWKMTITDLSTSLKLSANIPPQWCRISHSRKERRRRILLTRTGRFWRRTLPFLIAHQSLRLLLSLSTIRLSSHRTQPKEATTRLLPHSLTTRRTLRSDWLGRCLLRVRKNPRSSSLRTTLNRAQRHLLRLTSKTWRQPSPRSSGDEYEEGKFELNVPKTLACILPYLKIIP